MLLKKKKEDKTTTLMKTIIVFIMYLLYSFVFSEIAELFNFTDAIVTNFIGDIFFLIFVLFIYKDKIDMDKTMFHKDKNIKKRILNIIEWVCLIAFGNILGGFIVTLMTKAGNTPIENNIAVLSLPYFYKLFKVLIFSSIAEELVVKQSIREVIDNNLLFIIVSTLIYSTMNIAYTDLSGKALLVNAIPYAIFAVITSLLYIKNKDNIYVVIVVKMIYTLIPLTLMLIGVGI